MNYTDIDAANSGIKMLNLKGKDYAMVPERVTAFRKIFPDGFILTDIISHEGGVVLMQAKAGYYTEEGNPVVLGTGFAQEEKGKGLVNGTSYIENCETSAVGRALGFMGLGLNGGGICSAEELVNAITAQRQGDSNGKPFTPAVVSESATVPAGNQHKTDAMPGPTPVQAFLMKSMKELREARNITPAKNNKLFSDQRNALVMAKLVPDKKLEEYTMQEAELLINLMYEKFDPCGTEIKG